MRMRPFPEDHLTSKEIAAIQKKAWSRTFRHAFAHSPFYREHLRRAGLSPKKLIPFERIGEIPTISKEVLSENPEAFLCVPREQVVDIVTTSGSTGQPLVWRLTDPDMQRLALGEYHSFRCAGLTASDTVVLAVTLDRCFIAGMAYFMGLRMLGCSIVRVGSATPVMHLELLQRTRATAVVGVPSFLCLLADKAAEASLDLAGLGVRKLICIGEPVRQPDWSLNRAGELLERRWNARCSPPSATRNWPRHSASAKPAAADICTRHCCTWNHSMIPASRCRRDRSANSPRQPSASKPCR